MDLIFPHTQSRFLQVQTFHENLEKSLQVRTLLLVVILASCCMDLEFTLSGPHLFICS